MRAATLLETIRRWTRRSEVFSHRGHCPICERPVRFSARRSWFRDHLLCSGCGSIPRERALMRVIKDHYPRYRELHIHESSPGGRGASLKLAQECPNYSASQYIDGLPSGSIHADSGYRCENLEALTFSDESFDLFVTQDVMEHVFDPAQAFREIARVLRPGGAHIFTVPLVNKARKSECCASRDADKGIVHHLPPEYHGNPVDQNGSLVTMRWGYDIACFISETAGLPTAIVEIDNIDLGIRAEYIEVLVSFKMPR